MLLNRRGNRRTFMTVNDPYIQWCVERIAHCEKRMEFLGNLRGNTSAIDQYRRELVALQRAQARRRTR